jgi:chromosome segregation ATPase
MSETTQEPMADETAKLFEQQGTLAESMGGAITTLFETTLSQLIALRDARYANAIEELDHESEALSREYGELQTAIHDIETILPSEERLLQHQVDELLHSGKKQDAANKLAELKEFKHKPVAMRERQSEIHARLDEIKAEKRDIAKQVFANWYAKVQPVIRASERGLFITLLEGLSKDFYQFQERVGMVTLNNRERPLLTQNHFSNLTADGRSAEWAAGHKWYG